LRSGPSHSITALDRTRRSALHELPYASAISARLGPGQTAVPERVEMVDRIFEVDDHRVNGAPLHDAPTVDIADE